MYKNLLGLVLFTFLNLFFLGSVSKAQEDNSVGKWEDLPVIKCEGSDAYKEISLAANNTANRVAETDRKTISRLIQLEAPEFHDVGEASNIRIEGCVKNTKFNIRRILVREPFSGNFEVFSEANAEISSVQDLYTRLVEKDKTPFSITMYHKNGVDFGYLFATVPGNSNIIFLSPVAFSNGGFRATSVYTFVADELKEINPFPVNPCKRGQLSSNKFTIEQAAFEISYCYYPGGGETMGYDITEISLLDKSPKLSRPNSDKALIFQNEELADVLTYKWNHHNSCDSLVLKVKEYDAIYALTAPAIIGCGDTVEGAPKRDMNDRRGTTLYQITYGQESSKIKESLFNGSYIHY